MDPLYVGPSQNRQAWHAALSGQDDVLLSQLAEGEPPGVAHFEIATYINGLYRMTQHPFFQGRDVRPDVERVLPTVHAIRRRLGWRQCELDIGLMRWIRRASGSRRTTRAKSRFLAALRGPRYLNSFTSPASDVQVACLTVTRAKPSESLGFRGEGIAARERFFHTDGKGVH